MNSQHFPLLCWLLVCLCVEVWRDARFFQGNTQATSKVRHTVNDSSKNSLCRWHSVQFSAEMLKQVKEFSSFIFRKVKSKHHVVLSCIIERERLENRLSWGNLRVTKKKLLMVDWSLKFQHFFFKQKRDFFAVHTLYCVLFFCCHRSNAPRRVDDAGQWHHRNKNRQSVN